QRPLVHHDLAISFGHADAGHSRLPPAGPQVKLLLRAHVLQLSRMKEEGLRMTGLFILHPSSLILSTHESLNSFGFWAWCGWLGPAYIFSLFSWARPSRLRGTMRFTAWYRISSGLRSRISLAGMIFCPPA